MTKVIGVRFRTAGKIYFFSPGKLEIKTGDKVIVETARGVEFGSVVTGPKEVEDDKITQPLKSVIRLATEDDKKKEEKIKELQDFISRFSANASKSKQRLRLYALSATTADCPMSDIKTLTQPKAKHFLAGSCAPNREEFRIIGKIGTDT